MCTCDLCRNFRVERGDLLYGLADPRHWALTHLKQNRQDVKDAVENGYWHQINFYNDSTILAPSADRIADQIMKSPKTTEQIAAAEQFGREIVASKYNPFDLPPQQMVTQNISKTIHHPGRKATGRSSAIPPSTKTIQRTNYTSPKEGTFETQDDLTRYRKLRRGCKFGLVYLTTAVSPHARVHFMLDRLPMDEVAAKKPYKGKRDNAVDPSTYVPITYSELRAIYRNWESVRHHLFFYASVQAPTNSNSSPSTSASSSSSSSSSSTPSVVFMEQQAPWVTSPSPWNAYAERRFVKYYTALMDALPPGMNETEPLAANVEGVVAVAEAEARAGNVLQGSERLKKLLEGVNRQLAEQIDHTA